VCDREREREREGERRQQRGGLGPSWAVAPQIIIIIIIIMNESVIFITQNIFIIDDKEKSKILA